MSDDKHVAKMYEVTLTTGPGMHVPSWITFLQHLHNTDKDKAMLLLAELTEGNMSPAGLSRILTGELIPIFYIDDLLSDSLTFNLTAEDVAQHILDES